MSILSIYVYKSTALIHKIICALTFDSKHPLRGADYLLWIGGLLTFLTLTSNHLESSSSL
jgi:hypothetical protein